MTKKSQEWARVDMSDIICHLTLHDETLLNACRRSNARAADYAASFRKIQTVIDDTLDPSTAIESIAAILNETP